ncbi:hypothetical protein [Sulfurospirillum oryzae]|uniref:hypothetical protein n=1 Tax=Sulfurospirillum oryzae TaxID=2976535 RepID=UPI0021E7918A|nr:hypothetical protein [Sulfurospirillum oryzae]
MFSMILKLQALFERLKKHKALWFTTITAIAFFGIVGTLYYLNSMTHRATKNLYEATNTSYFNDLDTKIGDSIYNLEIIGSMLLSNPEFIAAINLQNNTSAMMEKLNTLDANLQIIAKNSIVIELYTKNFVKIASSSATPVLTTEAYDLDSLRKVVATNQPLSGIEYQDGQVFLKALYPTTNGILEIKRSADFLYDVYQANGKIFQILLDRDLLEMKKLQTFKHQKIGKNEISVQAKADSAFLSKIAELDFEKIIADKYLLSDDYFILAKPLLNVDGKKVGVIIVGESITKENSLPKMTKKISTGLTTAALGLVVALLILMI